MKIPPRQSESFIKNPGAGIVAVLVYGPDRGLVRERAKALSSGVVSDLNDPFNVSVISGDEAALDPVRVGDEARAISMMGGRRLVRVDDANDKIVPALKDYMEEPNPDAFIVISAGELSPRSALRKLFEGSINAAAVACYVEEGRDLISLIGSMAMEQGYRISSDALQWLAVNLQGDRGRVRSETEKLCLYAGDERNITMEMAEECCGEAGAQNIDTLVFATADGNSDKALTVYSRLRSEGVQDIVVLRSLQNHFRRLHFVKASAMDGGDVNKAMKSLRPPVFFKFEQSFRAQENRWSIKKIEKAMGRLMSLEAQCKQTGMPVKTLCMQAILGISKL